MYEPRNERTSFISILAMLGIICCLALAAGIWNIYNILEQAGNRQLQSNVVRDELATRLQVSENWDAIEAYIYCDIASAGRTQAQVEQDLLQIGDYQILTEPLSGHLIYSFEDKRIWRVIYGVYVRYNDEDIVDDVMIRETQGPIDSYEYKRFDCLKAVRRKQV